MVTDSATLVLFAIRSAVRLSHQLRLAYVDATKGRELVLPLPNFPGKVDLISAINFFEVLRPKHLAVPRVRELVEKSKTPPPLTKDEIAELLLLHTEYFTLDLAERLPEPTQAGAVLSANELNALLTIRQWQRDKDPNPPVLQRVAGVLIEIGVDYAATVPGAFREDSGHGKILKGFLSGLAQINFSEVQLRDVPQRLFVATLDTLAEQSSLLSSDPKVQELIRATTTGLSADVAARITANAGDLVKQERVADWAELVFRSVLGSAGRLVVSDPKRFLGVEGDAESMAVTRVGTAVLGLVLDQPDLRLDRLFGREGLDTVVTAALAAVGEHPEILHLNHAGLQTLLGEIASQLAGYDSLLTPDIIPEAARMVLARTGENLPLLWPDLAAHPANHLGLVTARTALGILSQPPPAGAKWTPRFSRDDLLAVTDAALGELVANPGWLVTEAGELDGTLAAVLQATLDVLRARADRRLGPAVGIEILRAALTAAAARQELVTTNAAGLPLVAAAIETVLATLCAEDADAKVRWRVVQAQVLSGVVRIGLEQLAAADFTRPVLQILGQTIEGQVQRVANGKPLDLAAFEHELHAALAA